MTATLSQAGWVVHDIGLATSIGGSLFGQVAMEPSLDAVSVPSERDKLSARAWNKFSWLKLASHAAFAVPWIIGRNMLSGSEVSSRARALTLAKDVLVATSLISGVTSFIIGRTVSKRALEGRGPDQERANLSEGEAPSSSALETSVAIVGAVNTLANIGVLAVTSLLAMEASESMRFAVTTRRLP